MSMTSGGAFTVLTMQSLNRENEQRRRCRIGKIVTKEGLLSRLIPVPKEAHGDPGKVPQFDRGAPGNCGTAR